MVSRPHANVKDYSLLTFNDLLIPCYGAPSHTSPREASFNGMAQAPGHEPFVVEITLFLRDRFADPATQNCTELAQNQKGLHHIEFEDEAVQRKAINTHPRGIGSEGRRRSPRTSSAEKEGGEDTLQERWRR